MSNGMEGAMDMAATGVGLGILTMGAMLPIKIMKKSLENIEEEKDEQEKPKKQPRQKGVVLPKVRITPRGVPRTEPFEFDAPKIKVPGVTLNYPTIKGMKKWKF